MLATTAPRTPCSEDPGISAVILNGLAGESVPAGTCALSNVQRIEAKIVLDRRGLGNLPPFAGAAINPEPVGSEDHFILVKITEGSNGSEVPVKAIAYEKTVENGKDVVKVTIELPEVSATRQTKIQAYVDQIKTQQASVPGQESQEIVDEIVAKNADIVAAMDKLYTENRTGNFTLVVEYHSTRAGAWIGQVASLPLPIAVLNKGSFFDSL